MPNVLSRDPGSDISIKNLKNIESIDTEDNPKVSNLRHFNKIMCAYGSNTFNHTEHEGFNISHAEFCVQCYLHLKEKNIGKM